MGHCGRRRLELTPLQKRVCLPSGRMSRRKSDIWPNPLDASKQLPNLARCRAMETERRIADVPSPLEDDHLLRSHFRRRIGDAADAVAGLAPPGKWHPVGAKRAMIVHHHR